MLVAMAFGVIPATAQTGSGTGSPALPATQPVVQDPAAAGGANAVDTADGEALSRKQKRKVQQQAEGEEQAADDGDQTGQSSSSRAYNAPSRAPIVNE